MRRLTKTLPGIFWSKGRRSVQQAYWQVAEKPKINMSRNRNLPVAFDSPTAQA